MLIEEPLLSIETIRKMLSDRNLKKVGERVGLSYPTMLSLANGEDRDYSHRVIKAISQYLQRGIK